MANETPLLVHVTTRTEAEAALLARGLLEARLAACVHIRPVRSLYRWEGAIQSEEEQELAITTTEARWEALVEFVRAHHSYQVPQIVALPITHGLAPVPRVGGASALRSPRHGEG
jgi:periplasmic divalent cation tolerance protein